MHLIYQLSIVRDVALAVVLRTRGNERSGGIICNLPAHFMTK